MYQQEQRLVPGSRRRDAALVQPIPGVSHWCDGYTAQGLLCTQIVRDDSDHCEAGHRNAVRLSPATEVGRYIYIPSSQPFAIKAILDAAVDHVASQGYDRARTLHQLLASLGRAANDDNGEIAIPRGTDSNAQTVVVRAQAYARLVRMSSAPIDEVVQGLTDLSVAVEEYEHPHPSLSADVDDFACHTCGKPYMRPGRMSERNTQEVSLLSNSSRPLHELWKWLRHKPIEWDQHDSSPV